MSIPFQTIHGLFVRTVPSYADEARPMNRLVVRFNWSKVILVTSSEYDYRQLFVKFTSLAYDSGISVSQFSTILFLHSGET